MLVLQMEEAAQRRAEEGEEADYMPLEELGNQARCSLCLLY
jgi:hypothetical protein